MGYKSDYREERYGSFHSNQCFYGTEVKSEAQQHAELLNSYAVYLEDCKKNVVVDYNRHPNIKEGDWRRSILCIEDSIMTIEEFTTLHNSYSRGHQYESLQSEFYPITKQLEQWFEALTYSGRFFVGEVELTYFSAQYAAGNKLNKELGYYSEDRRSTDALTIEQLKELLKAQELPTRLMTAGRWSDEEFEVPNFISKDEAYDVATRMKKAADDAAWELQNSQFVEFKF